MPKISDEKRESRRRQILEAAWICFQDRGLHETTMDDIIRTSGLSAGAVYSYFSSKDDLILSAVTTSLAGLGEVVIPMLKADPALPPEMLAQGITTAIDEFTTRAGYDLKRIALMGWSEAQHNERLKSAMQVFYRAVRDAVAESAKSWKASGVIAGDAEASSVAKAFVSLVLGYVVQSSLLGDVAPKDMATGLKHLMA